MAQKLRCPREVEYDLAFQRQRLAGQARKTGGGHQELPTNVAKSLLKSAFAVSTKTPFLRSSSIVAMLIAFLALDRAKRDPAGLEFRGV
ncbi:MAG TPA: hypothetical protein VI876_13415 [Dehalococcoidia bacterium]|nr:hypothetical protein [Dehalococcoidia bacterium]